MNTSIIKIIFSISLCFVTSLSFSQEMTRVMIHDSNTGRYLSTVQESFFDDGSVSNYKERNDVDFTFLPVLVMTSNNDDFGYEYSNGTVSLYMPDGSDQTEMYAKVKWRGGTTNSAEKHKRNYHIKFTDELGNKQNRKFFGLRNDNSWLLDAAQVDMSRVRNRVATDLWNDFSTKPYYYESEKNVLTGTRGQFVEVLLNGKYMGIYCMTEAIDRSQMKIKKFESASVEDNTDPIIHGLLYKSGGFKNAMSWSSPTDYDNTSEKWGDIEIKYPDIEDVNPTDWSVMYNAAKFVDNIKHNISETVDREDVISSRNLFSQNIHEYFDIPVLIDYYVFFTVLSAIDNNNGKNIYWACYDSKVDKKLTLAVWDLDCTVGGYFNHSQPIPVKDVWPYRVATCTSNLFYTLDKINACGFHDKMVERYRSLRNTVFSAENLKQRYIDYMNMLEKSGAYDREKSRWSGDSDIGGKILDFKSERENICNWIDERLVFLDDNIDDTPEQHYSRGLPVMEIEGQPYNKGKEDAAIVNVFITDDDGMDVYFSDPSIIISKDIETGKYHLEFKKEVDLTRNNRKSCKWILCPDSEKSEGMKTDVFIDGISQGIYSLVEESGDSGIIAKEADKKEHYGIYNVIGIKVNESYSGIIIKKATNGIVKKVAIAK